MTVSSITRRRMIGGLAAGVGASSVISSDAFIGSARAQSAQKTFVLVPGAFYGAWSWRRVSDRLVKQGHRVYPLTLTGLAERSHLLSKDINLDTHIADIANIVEWEDLTDICLVAHSYAGYPASGALERIGNRVSSIVWVDALKPADGQSFRDQVPFQMEEGAISRPAPKALPPTAFNDPKDVAWVLSKVTPQPIGTWLQPVKLSGAREKVAKKTYIRLPKFQLAALDKAFADCKADKSWTAIENTTSGHSVMIAEPDWLTDLLLQAA
ncbi:alpha/beta fold hydrolase [Bradyrhizobium jicamae]|nr:alpha/beta hydrolase family protein [Bradyrhizobium jicamae]